MKFITQKWCDHFAKLKLQHCHLQSWFLSNCHLFLIYLGTNLLIPKCSERMRKCACVSVSAHQSECKSQGQIQGSGSGGSSSPVSKRAVTLIANHTHERTHVHFLKGSCSRQILRPRVCTRSNIIRYHRNFFYAVTDACKHPTQTHSEARTCLQTHTQTHTHSDLYRPRLAQTWLV